MKKYKLIIVRSVMDPEKFSIRDENREDPRNVISRIVKDHNLKSGDMIEISVEGVKNEG